MTATGIARAPRVLTEQLIRQWERVFDALWSPADPEITPAELIAELGTTAGQIFAANSALVTFILTTIGDSDPALSAKIMAKVATIPEHTLNEDGTVTLV
jgi:hypothetical protein